ncbi:MAG: dTDP-4-dehydrorhamnose reductase [Saprospiraceae bacterium]
MNKIPVTLTIMVIGSDGQIGSELQRLQHTFINCHFHFFSRNIVDVTNYTSIKTQVDAVRPDFLINCSAFTAVDAAETDSDTCMQINVEGVNNIIKAVAHTNTFLIHFSSDYVYHRPGPWPIKETDMRCPIGVYAISKALGDEAIMASDIKYMIWRISWVVSPYKHNFVKTILRLASERSELKIVSDQFGAITYTYDLVCSLRSAIETMRDQPNSDYTGVYNYANEGMTTWYDIAKRIVEYKNISCEVTPIPTSEYPTPATRPHWSVMDKDKVKTTFNLSISHWYSALIRCIDEV